MRTIIKLKKAVILPSSRRLKQVICRVGNKQVFMSLFIRLKHKALKKAILNLTLFICGTFQISAQSKPTIAVTNPIVNGLHSSPEIAAKILRLEINKLELYNLYDEFDMIDIYKKDSSYEYHCVSTSCLIEIGQALRVDYVISGSYDALGNKIVISLKMVDVKNNTIYKTMVKEFDDQELELQRMTQILVREMHDMDVEKQLSDRLSFNNEVITSSNVGKINNSGPRVGFAFLTGSFYEFATRSTSRGGLDIFPGVSMIGYQIEGQYVGTENFSALVECVLNVSGLEQSVFMPSISILNGFRFGKAGWEFAFGPGFGVRPVSRGFFDTKGLFGTKDLYYSQQDWIQYTDREFNNESTHPEYFTDGYFTAPSPDTFDESYSFNQKVGDTRGAYELNTMFIIALGRTFRAGALNVPVNIFYSSRKGGGMLGLSVGFNVLNHKKPINPSIR